MLKSWREKASERERLTMGRGGVGGERSLSVHQGSYGAGGCILARICLKAERPCNELLLVQRGRYPPQTGHGWLYGVMLGNSHLMAFSPLCGRCNAIC
jgi:hypothetical protein